MGQSIRAGHGPVNDQLARAADLAPAPAAEPSFVAVAIQRLVRPGRAPAGWAKRSSVMVAAAVVACLLIASIGRARHGIAGHYFREGTIGTYLSVGLLAASGVAGILIGRRLPREQRRVRSYWLVLGTLLVFLAVDDLFKLHESIDHAWHRMTGWDAKRGPTAHLDNWIVASYALVAGALFWRHRRYVATLGWFNRTMALAFAVFAAMVYADTFVFHHEVEDSLKIIAGTLILCAFLSVATTPAPRDEPTVWRQTSHEWHE